MQDNVWTSGLKEWLDSNELRTNAHFLCRERELNWLVFRLRGGKTPKLKPSSFRLRQRSWLLHVHSTCFDQIMIRLTLQIVTEYKLTFKTDNTSNLGPNFHTLLSSQYYSQSAVDKIFSCHNTFWLFSAIMEKGIVNSAIKSLLSSNIVVPLS